jgi:hypothetical protein
VRRAGLPRLSPALTPGQRRRRRRLDLDTRTVRIRAAHVERSTGETLLGPPKSKAGRRVVGIPDAIVPALREHLAIFVKDALGALVSPGARGCPVRRESNPHCHLGQPGDAC